MYATPGTVRRHNRHPQAHAVARACIQETTKTQPQPRYLLPTQDFPPTTGDKPHKKPFVYQQRHHDPK